LSLCSGLFITHCMTQQVVISPGQSSAISGSLAFNNAWKMGLTGLAVVTRFTDETGCFKEVAILIRLRRKSRVIRHLGQELKPPT
jgi:hypothetical protein